MGAKGDCLTIFIMLSALMLFKNVESSQNSSQDSLNSFLHSYALAAIPKPRTGRPYEVSLPANFSGAGVSFLRLRTNRLWKDGANLSSVEIPPTAALPSPFTRRVDLVYQNLGNWSTSYYNVPNYTFVAPVIGLLAYDAGPAGLGLGLDVKGESSITVNFDGVSRQYDVGMLRCVWFAADGTWRFSNVSGGGSSCEGRSHGHFSIVAPRSRGRKKKAALKWWMVGVPGGAVAAALIAFLGIFLWKICRWRRERKMERNSERSEGLNTVWIGSSRMPTASGIRTQPNLETSYIP